MSKSIKQRHIDNNVGPLQKVKQASGSKRKRRIIAAKEKGSILKRAKDAIIKAFTITTTNVYTVNLGFQRLSRAKYFTYINKVLNLMSTSTHYPTPFPTLITINDMIDLYNNAHDSKDYINANIYLAQIKLLMKQLCIYIANTCTNDLAILESVGVTANKLTRGPKFKMTKVLNVVFSDNGHPGNIVAKYLAVEGAQGYIARGRVTGGGGAYTIIGTKKGLKMVITGLTPGVFYDIQIFADGSLGEGPGSTIQSYMSR